MKKMVVKKDKLKAVFIVAEDIIKEDIKEIWEADWLVNSTDIMLINGAEIDKKMSLLDKKLSSRIDSNTVIYINAHGNKDEDGLYGHKGLHIIQLNSDMQLPSYELIGKIQDLAKTSIQIYLDSCFSSNGIKHAVEKLKYDSV